MTTPALTAATGPAALGGASAGPGAPEGVFAGLLADAAPAAAPSAQPAVAAAPDGAALLGLLELLPEQPQEPVLPDGSLLGAAALGLVPAPLLLDAAPVDGTDPSGVLGTALPVDAAAAAGGSAAVGPEAAVPVQRAAEAAVQTAAQTAAQAAAQTALQADAQTDLSGTAPSAAATAVPTTPAPAEVPADAPGAARADAATAAATAAARDASQSAGAAPVEPSALAPDAPEAATPDPAHLDPAHLDPAHLEPVPVQAVPAPSPTAATAPAAPTAPAPLERLAAETGPEQVRPAVAELARGLRDAGGGRASLVVRLDPPELGPVLVRLTVQDGRVDVQLRTSESVAAVGLGQASADVRNTLLEHGLDLSSFDVASDGDASFSQQLSQGSPDRGTPGDRRAADDRDSASGAGAAPGDITETTADGAPAGAWL